MGKFTDIFIRRPVLSIVVSLLIFIIGLSALESMPLREYPQIEETVVSVVTSYYGASAELVEGFITSIIEKSIASAEGIDYISSSSIAGQSQIQVTAKLNFDSTTIFTDIMSKVSAVENQLPSDSQQPVISKSTGDQADLLYVSFSSKTMSAEQITDYITRVIQPKIETVSGVSQAEILGDKTFAMRIWLDSKRMTALNVTASDVANVLQSNNYQSAAGSTKGDYVTFSIRATTQLEDKAAFENMVVKNVNGALVRIRDIGKVELGAEDYNSSVTFNAKQAVFVGVTSTPSANPLTVIEDVKELLPKLKALYPPGLDSKVVYDATRYIQASLNEVIATIAEATLIVVLVIFLFLGSLRTVLIPVVTIPLSLIGVCSIMSAFGYSLNLLTLLAMVLAIGLVVDDAIVVVENIYRHIEAGLDPFHAAIKGAREIALPIIAMTITLASVYAPIGFMGGLTGALFTEFAFTLAGSVIISGVIALTLSPMMCSKVLSKDVSESRIVKYIDERFERLKQWYAGKLHGVLDHRGLMIVIAVTILSSCAFLYVETKSELAPDEDQGVLFVSATGPQYANLPYMEKYTDLYNTIFASFKSVEDYFVVNGFSTVNTALAAIIMKPWDERTQSQSEAKSILQQKVNNIAGLQSITFGLASLPGGGSGLPFQYVLTSIQPLSKMYPIAEKMVSEAKKSGLFLYVTDSLRFNNPQLVAQIDRNKAGDLGISMQSIGNVLASSLGGNYVNYFSMSGKSYEVIPQLSRRFRLNPSDVEDIHITTSSGDLVPLSSFVNLRMESEPNAYTHFQQLNSATVEGVLVPGVTMDQALAFLDQVGKKEMSSDMSVDYAGQLRQYVQEGDALLLTFFLAIIIIYLVLAAQFESFRDPLIILISVPMSICGALIPLNLGAATINIYTQIGLVTLIGLISKHGILMVEFANQLQKEQGYGIREAIEHAAAIRLRPILMTTAAMVLGVLPLLLASGAGAVSRFDIGVVITSGMLIGTMFTLFMVPTMYTLIAKEHAPLRAIDESILEYDAHDE